MRVVAPREVPSRFAVAFSLAGEQRELILPVAQEVESVLGRSTVFYDEWYEHWIAGPDSDLLLQGLYGELSELVVVCISSAYGSKAWTQTEHRAIRARFMESPTQLNRLSTLPIRVGEGEVSGVLFNEIVPDIRGKIPAQSSELIIARLNLIRSSTAGLEPSAPRWPDIPPELKWPMANHSETRGAFALLLCESSPARILLIRGASETGKTHMSRQMAWNCMAMQGIYCGRFDFKGTVNMNVEVEALCQFLEIEPPPGGTLIERLGRILAQLRRRAEPTVLIFDSYESAGEARDWVEKILLPQVVSARWLRIVIIGQSVPIRLGTTWEPNAAKILTLETPRPEHWLEYGRANRGDVDLTFVTQAHHYADGKASVLAQLLGPRS